MTEEKKEYPGVHVIGNADAKFILSFLNDLDMPLNSRKRCVQIISTLPELDTYLESLKEKKQGIDHEKDTQDAGGISKRG